MLWRWRDPTGQLLAVCEWHLADEQGKLTADGPYLWVAHFETSHGVVLQEAMRKLIVDLATFCPDVWGAYWQRHAKPTEPVLHFSRSQLLRFATANERSLV